MLFTVDLSRLSNVTFDLWFFAQPFKCHSHMEYQPASGWSRCIAGLSLSSPAGSLDQDGKQDMFDRHLFETVTSIRKGATFISLLDSKSSIPGLMMVVQDLLQDLLLFCTLLSSYSFTPGRTSRPDRVATRRLFTPVAP